MSTVEQSGTITPGHLVSWATSGVIQDAGITFFNTYGEFVSNLIALNFNSANTDYPVPIYLPVGYTRYRVESIIISGASINISAVTCGVFTGQNGTGTAVVTSGSAITVNQTTVDTVNNMQSLAINNQNTMALTDGVLYFRVQTAAGAAATANISVRYEPLP